MELGAREQVALATHLQLGAQEVGEELRVGRLGLARGVQAGVELVGGLDEPERLELLAGALEGDHAPPAIAS